MTDTNHIEVLRDLLARYRSQLGNTSGYDRALIDRAAAAITALSARASAGEGERVWKLVGTEKRPIEQEYEVGVMPKVPKPIEWETLYFWEAKVAAFTKNGKPPVNAAPQPAQAGASGGGEAAKPLGYVLESDLAQLDANDSGTIWPFPAEATDQISGNRCGSVPVYLAPASPATGEGKEKLVPDWSRAYQRDGQTFVPMQPAATPQPAQAGASGGGELRAWVGDMKTSAGMDYYVCVGRDTGNPLDRTYLTPNKYSIRGRAEYDVAEWNHLLGHGPKPDILAFDTQPAPASPAAGGLVSALLNWQAEMRSDSECSGLNNGYRNACEHHAAHIDTLLTAPASPATDHCTCPSETRCAGTCPYYLRLHATPQPAAAQREECKCALCDALNMPPESRRRVHELIAKHPELFPHAILATIAAAPQPQGTAFGHGLTKEPLTITPAHGDGEGDYAAKWFAEVRRVLEDVSTEMRATGRGDTRFRRLIESMPRQLTTRPTPEAQEARDAANAKRYLWLRDNASRAQLEIFADRRGTRLAADRVCDAGVDIAALALPAQGEGR